MQMLLIGWKHLLTGVITVLTGCDCELNSSQASSCTHAYVGERTHVSCIFNKFYFTHFFSFAWANQMEIICKQVIFSISISLFVFPTWYYISVFLQPLTCISIPVLSSFLFITCLSQPLVSSLLLSFLHTAQDELIVQTVINYIRSY